jgi:NAD(P)-dependent dehydrogenase (short-subunit alcohol dehydrogenase family)
MSADEQREPLVVERQHHDDAVRRHSPPALGEVPQGQAEALVDALVMADRQGDGERVRTTDAAAEQLGGRFGRLDMAFNNAGIQVPPSDAADETAENFDRVNAIKHGVIGLTKSAAMEYAPRGVRINAVCPGTIDTPMVADMLESQPEAMQEIMKEQPIGRLGRSEEIAAAVLWLCSPGASFVVGVALPVDGGFTAH